MDNSEEFGGQEKTLMQHEKAAQHAEEEEPELELLTC